MSNTLDIQRVIAMDPDLVMISALSGDDPGVGISLALEYGEKLWLLSDGGLESTAPDSAGAPIDRAFGHGRMRFNSESWIFLPVSPNSGE